MSASTVLVLAFVGFLVVGVVVATAVAVIDNLFIYKKRGRTRTRAGQSDGDDAGLSG